MTDQQLAECAQRLSQERRSWGWFVRRSAIRALARDRSPEAVNLLAETVVGNRHRAAREQARKALQRLAASASIPAREALCRLVLEHADAAAQAIATKAGYAPHDEYQRAAFLFLTGQWETYEALDFEHAMLRAAYARAEPGLRRRIAEQARRAGRLDWIEVVTGGRRGLRLHEMTDEEWQTVLDLLVQGKHYEELWELAQVSSPRWSVRLLGALAKAKWQPVQDPSRADYEQLSKLAAGLQTGEPPLLNPPAPVTLEGHTDFVRHLAITPDGRVLASGSGDRTIRLWSLSDGRLLGTGIGHTEPITCLAISPDSRLLASGSQDRTIRLWSIPEGKPLRTLEGHLQWISFLAVTPDGKMLVSGSINSDRGVHGRALGLWGLPDGGLLKMLEGHTGAITGIVTTPDGRLFASGSSDKTVRLWSLPDGRPLKTLSGHRGPVRQLAVTPDGRTLISGSRQAIRLWNLPDGTPSGTIEEYAVTVECLAVTSDGRTLVGGDSQSNAIRRWNLPDGKLLGTMSGRTDISYCLAVSPDGRVLAGGGGQTVRLWSLPDGRQNATLVRESFSRVTCLAMTPDGSILASGSDDRTVCLWNLALARLAQLPVAHATHEAIAFLQQRLKDRDLTNAQHHWLELTEALLRIRLRYDITTAAAPNHIVVGDYDIQLSSKEV